jgi:hypothetical protein
LDTFESFKSQLYTVNETTFQDIALQLFRFQASNNPLYKTFVQHLGINPQSVTDIIGIPFMPISFFKLHSIKTGAWQPEMEFYTSGTTAQQPGKHPIFSLKFYLDHAERCFQQAFGALGNYHFFALLPSYLERSGSSLVAMLDHFIKRSESEFSGFYLHQISQLLADIDKAKRAGRKVVLWGVSFALLDLAQTQKPDLAGCLVFETGGMKGRRKEVTRHELHSILKKGLNLDEIYSEYGMTELLSQAYTAGGERFFCPPWLKIIGRDLTDPLQKGLLGETSGINVIDLANWHSIAFIETEDLGKVYADGSFEVLGRIDNSDVRGCNLLVE